MGPNGSGKSTLAYVLAGKADYTPTAGEVLFNGKNIFDMAPDERAAAGLFLAFQYPLEIPGVATMTFLRTALNAQRKKRGEAELSTPEFIKKVRERRRQARHRPGHAAPRRQCRLLRRREEAQRDFADGAARAAACGARRNRFRARHRRAQDRRRRRQPAALAEPRFRRHHALPAAARLHRARRRARAVEAAASSRPAARNWRSSSKRAAMPSIRKRPRRERRRHHRSRPRRRPRWRRPLRRRGRGCRATSAVAAQRDGGFRPVRQEGLPHRRIEDWKYTDLRALMRDAKPLASPPDAGGQGARQESRRAGRRCRGAPPGFCRRRLCSGIFRHRRLERGLAVGSLADALADGDPTLTAHLGKLAPASDVAVALNTALMGDGAVIRIAAGSTIERPLHLLFVASEKPAATSCARWSSSSTARAPC